MARPSAKPGSKETATGPASDDLRALLEASARRTEAALAGSAKAPGAFEGDREWAVEHRGADRTPGFAPPPTTGRTPTSRRLLSNDLEAIARRLRRMGKTDAQIQKVLDACREEAKAEEDGEGEAEAAIDRGVGTPTRGLVLEGLVGRLTPLDVSYLEAGQRAARPVGRVVVRDRRGSRVRLGTGFLVAPRLLLTNHHVLPTGDAARSGWVEFDYQRDVDGQLDPDAVVRFDFDPGAFFVTSPALKLDFTLVAVSVTSQSGGRSPEEFGRLALAAGPDEVLAGEAVTIVQHPGGEPKQIALRDNEVIRVPQTGGPFLHYETATLPGSSGAPVFNNDWEVIAVHHAGKPVTVGGVYLCKDGTPWDDSKGLDAIQWEANEGVRSVAILEAVEARGLSPSERRLYASALEPPPRRSPGNGTMIESPGAIAIPAGPTVLLSTTAGPAETPDGVTFTIPLEVTVRVGKPWRNGP